MPAEHKRLNPDGTIGLYQGYYCMRCGKPGMSMYGHRDNDRECKQDQELVKELMELNK